MCIVKAIYDTKWATKIVTTYNSHRHIKLKEDYILDFFTSKKSDNPFITYGYSLKDKNGIEIEEFYCTQKHTKNDIEKGILLSDVNVYIEFVINGCFKNDNVTIKIKEQ